MDARTKRRMLLRVAMIPASMFPFVVAGWFFDTRFGADRPGSLVLLCECMAFAAMVASLHGAMKWMDREAAKVALTRIQTISRDADGVGHPGTRSI